MFGKRGAQGAQTLDFELGLKHAGLELDGAEAVFIHHAARLFNQLLRSDGLAPVVTRVAGVTVVLGKFIKQVSAVAHMRAHCAAQQVMHRPAGDLALQVPERHFESAQRAGAGLVTLGCKSFADVRLIAYAAVHRLRQRVQMKRVHADQRRRNAPQVGQCVGFAIAFTQTNPTAFGFNLNDAAQSPRLVHARHVQQRRVSERNGCDSYVCNALRHGAPCGVFRNYRRPSSASWGR